MAQKSAVVVAAAVEKWAKAPGHIKMMAGDFVLPLLEALKVLSEEVAHVSQRVDFIEQKEG